MKSFLLFHHDPSHDDRFIARLEKEAKKDFQGAIASREQMVLDLDTGKVRAPRPLATAPSRIAARRSIRR